MTEAGRPLLTLVLSTAATAAAWHVLRAAPPGGPELWERPNHAGRTVTLLEGPSVVSGAATAALLGGAGPSALVATLGAGGLGAWDDLAGDTGPKGLRGHLGALVRGRLSTGVVKTLGLGLTGLLAAAALGSDRHDSARLLDLTLGAGVVAGSANLINLLDLRPGRALKVALLAGVPFTLAGSRPAAAATGAALAVLRDDMASRSMLGDTGANSLGALLGLALVGRTGTRGRLVGLSLLTALTLASERVSFTSIIERTPGLRELDAWGRR